MHHQACNATTNQAVLTSPQQVLWAVGVLLGGLPSIKLPAMGLIVAIYGTTLVVSMAGDKFSLKEVLGLATVLSIMSYLAFIVLLKLQFPVWPTFIAG